MEETIELEGSPRRIGSSRGRVRFSSEGVTERPTNRRLGVTSPQPGTATAASSTNSLDLDRITVATEFNGGATPVDESEDEFQSDQESLRDYFRSTIYKAQDKDLEDRALACFENAVQIFRYALNLAFMFLMVPCCMAVDQGRYRLRSYAVQTVPYVLSISATTIYLLFHFIFEFGNINMEKAPEEGFNTATEFMYLLCVLGHVWMLVCIRKNFQSFVNKFTATNSGMFAMCAKLTPLALIILAGSVYVIIGEEIRSGETNIFLDATYKTGTNIFHVSICNKMPFSRCQTVVRAVLLAIQIFLEIQKYILEIQMLASSGFLYMVADELEQQCIGIEDMADQQIVWFTRLFSVARELVGDLNASNWSLSIFYYAQIPPFLVLALFKIVNRDWRWLAKNGLLLLCKLVVPLLASSSTRRIAQVYTKLSDKIQHRQRDIEGLLDPIYRTEKRTQRDALIKDFDKAAKDPITLRCLNYFSIHDRYIIGVVGVIFCTSLTLLELSIGIKRGANTDKDMRRMKKPTSYQRYRY